MSRILKKGDQGPDVADLQKLLISNGYSAVSDDGDFGPTTDTSIKDFQGKHGLSPDGVVGNMTMTALQGGKVTTYNDVPKSALSITDMFLPDDEYYKEIVKKDTIYIHHTAGGSRPDFVVQGWDADKASDGSSLKVGTAFVIGRASSSTGDAAYDGKIYRAFDEKFWCHHLGTTLSNNKYLNQKSIAIEICNYGYLKQTPDGKYINYVNREVLPDQVIKLSTPYKGYEYWEKYTDAQLNSLKMLLLDLANRYNIDIKRKITDSWFGLNQEAMDGHPGLWTHVNVRADKYDCTPQQPLIDMINSL